MKSKLWSEERQWRWHFTGKGKLFFYWKNSLDPVYTFTKEGNIWKMGNKIFKNADIIIEWVSRQKRPNV